MFRIRVIEEVKTHVMCSITFFFLKNRPLYEKMWENIVERGRSQITTWRIRFECWVPKATDTTCNTSCLSTARMAARKRLTRYKYIVC